MKKIELGQAVSVLANVGVIVGIAFLAIEISQNNELLQAEARRYQLDARTTTTRLQFSSPELLEASFKLNADEPLTQKEEYILRGVAFLTLRSWEWQYGEFSAGILQEDELPVAGWRFMASGNTRLRDAWQEQAGGLDPEFVRFMNENVFLE